jgi:peptidoglycan/LPS O-acetylase OafA/YrhL
MRVVARYLPALDGLRALAVLAVLLYHTEASPLPGGFLGVEVFFVLSGFLITALLLDQWRTLGRIDPRRFWLRRARRLLPAVLALLVIVLVVTDLFLPDELAGLRGQALAAFLYAANWQLIFQHTSYFESVGRPPLLRHLWSLAVEEQFYLAWPLLLVLGLGLFRPRLGTPAIANPRIAMGGVALLLALASGLLMAALYVPDADPSRVYYGTDTRASGPLVGAALALAWQPAGSSAPGRRRWLDLLGLAGLGLLVGACLRLSEFDRLLYRGGFLGVDLAAALVIAAASHPLAHPGWGLLGRQPLRWLGLRSYSVYLWHWPVFTLTRPQLDLPLEGWPLVALRLAVTAALAELSYRVVERPIREGALERAWRAWGEADGARRRTLGLRWAGVAGVLVVGLAALGTSVAAARPPERPAYLATEAVDTWSSSAPARAPRAAAVAGVPAAGPAPPPVQAGARPSGIPPAPAGLAVPTAVPPPAATVVPEDRGTVRSVERGTGAPDTAEQAPTVVADALFAAAADTAPADAGPDAAAADAPPAPRVAAIGDSVMLGAVAALQDTLGPIEIDAAESRQAAAGIQVLQDRRAAGELGDVVIVQLGNNGPLSAEQFDALMDTLADVRRVVLLTVKVPRPWEGPTNAVIMAGAQRYPNVVLVDWRAASAGQPGLFWGDGLHLRPQGARLYASMIADAVNAP